ncbi:MAG: hypothetical protein Q9169_008275 [Polycauliona sp. 2 TL-2023]
MVTQTVAADTFNVFAFRLFCSVLGKCECGYSVKGQGTYTDAFEADFFHQNDIGKNWEVSNWPMPDWKPFAAVYKPDNVISNPLSQKSGDPGLQLFARGPTETGHPVSIAELATTRGEKMREGPQNDATKQEIDFEILSYEDTDASPLKQIHVVNHGKNDHDTQEPKVPFRPSDGYHEYRFDWSPGKVAFFVDGKHIQDLTKLVPTVPGRILLNHWSHGQDGWEQGPPKQDALMTVAYVKAYFNTTSAAPECADPEAKDAICEVPDQLRPVSPETPTTFLTDVDSTYGDGGLEGPINPATTSTTEPAPTVTSSGKISPSNTCGGDEGFTCLNGPAGNCCSSAGWWYVGNRSSIYMTDSH